jgi:uncharacterized RDD family membrane protein YckC
VPTDVPPPGAPAELGSRLVARLVDGLVVVLVLVPLLAAGLVPEGTATGALAGGTLGYLYAASFDATGGTLGKRLLRLSVVGPDGTRPGLGAGATRNLWLLTSLLPGLGGQAVAVGTSVAVAISIARHPAERGWHDRVAGTAVRRSA